MLMVVVHSHRHNKEEAFLAEFNLDFTIVRDTMYKYSKKSQERFLSYPVFAFLLLWFASSPQGLEFLREKYSQKGMEYVQRMKEELGDLQKEAAASIQKFISKRNDENVKLLAA